MTNNINKVFNQPLKYKKSHWLSADAMYFVDNRKLPVAYSTVSELLTLRMLDNQFQSLSKVADAFNQGLLILSKTEQEIIEVKLSYGDDRLWCLHNY